MAFTIEFVSPESILYSGEGTMVTARTRGGGDIAFLAGHEPFEDPTSIRGRPRP